MTAHQIGGLDPAIIRETMLAAAQVASLHTLPRFRTPMLVDNKWTTGFDPVTDADREAERAISELISARFPDHGIVGEEWEPKLAQSPFEWIIDPIDGTRAFISGVPVWGTLVGLTYNGRAVAGLMAQPFTGEVYLSVPGESHYHRGEQRLPLSASTVRTLAGAKLSTTSPDLFEKSGTVRYWDLVRSKALQTRYGLDCYAYCLLAAGHIDLVIEAGLKNVDIAPLIPIIENAGGIVTTWDGSPAEQGGNIIAAATRELHAEAMALLR